MSNPYTEAAAGLSTASPGNRYAADAADLADSQRESVRTNVYSMTGSPEQAASAVRLGRQTGLPADLVQRNQPSIERRVAAERVDTDTAAAPVLRRRYTDPTFAALAHDDSAALAGVERVADAYTFGNALKKGIAGGKLTLDFLADQMARAVGADRSETQSILNSTAGFYRAQGADPQLQAAGERAKAAGGDTWYGTLLHLPGEVAAAENPFQLLGKFMTEQLPASLVGFGIGAAATAPIRAVVVSKVSSALVAKGVSLGVAGAAGNGTAVVVQSLGTNYTEGLGQGLKPEQAASRAWTKTLAEVPANAIAGAAMGLRIGPNQLTNIFSQAAVQGAGGGIGAAQAAHAVGEEADPVEIALEILGEGVSAGPEVAGLTFSRIAESRSVKAADTAAAAVADAQQVGAIIKAADASALKARDPQTFADLVEHIQPDARLYIAPEHLAGVDLSAVPAVAAQVVEAQANGGDVEITLADLVAHLPGDQLLQHLRTAPAAMTAAEAEGFDGRVELETELLGREPVAVHVEQAYAAAERMRSSGQTLDDFVSANQLTPVVHNLLLGLHGVWGDKERADAMMADFTRAVVAFPRRSATDLSADVVEASMERKFLTHPDSSPGADRVRADVAPIGDALLTSPDQGNMSADDWTAYLAAADESAQLAIERRDTRSLRDMKWLANAKTKAAAEIRGLADAARVDIETAVAAEIVQQPAYAAQRFMATAEAQGLHPDVIAEQFGYSSADVMARDIAESEPEAQAIERMVDERMLDEHPDIADAIGRERSAEALISDRARARFLATEAAALSNALGSKAMLERDAQRYAEQSIARRQVRNIRPAQFEAAADRAGKQAGAAFRRGDTAAAAKFKRDQALQTALEAEATSATDEVERALASFKRMLKPDDGQRDGNLADTARAVLAQYGLARTDKTAADYLARVEHYDPELHADLLVLIDGMPAAMPYRDLTVADFRAVRDRVDALWSLARTTRQIEIDGQMVEIGSAAQALAARLADEPQATREKMVGTNTRLDLRMRLAGMRAALRRVEFWADARDRGNSAGPFRTYVWQPVSEAVTRYRAERNRYVNRFLALLKSVEPTLRPGKIAAPELGDGMVFADRSALLHALLHTGNESNKRKLLLGYQWAAEREDGSLDTTRWDNFLARMHDEKRVTKTEWDFVQATWTLLDEIKPSAQAAHKRMFGHFFNEVTAEPVQTPFGELRGGYVPAVTDSLLVPEARTHGAMDDMLAGQNSPMFPAVNRGFTKGRIENYARPLALDLRMLPAHIDKVTRFATLGPVLRDAARLVTRNRTFRAAMDAVDPTAVESMLVPWLKRTATQSLNKAPESQGDRAVAKLANTVRNRTGLLLMAGNVVNTLQQFTGLSVAALRVKPRYLAAGMVEYLRSPAKAAQAINELSPWMQQRSDNGARDIDQAISDMLTNPNALQRGEQFGMRYGYALQQTAQNFIDRIVWTGAYREAEAGAGVTDANAVRQADSAVRMTQSSFAPEDASKVEHAGAFTRLFLQFFSYFNGQANLIATEGQNARGSAARLAMVYLLGFAVPAFVADVIGKGMRGDLDGDDDDGDELADQLLKSFFVSQARYALAMVPVAGQVGNAALGQLTPQRFDDRIGASPAYSALEATVRAPRSIYRAMEGEGNPRAAVRDGLTAVGVLTGLPTGPLVRPLGYLADDERDGVTVRGLVTGSSK